METDFQDNDELYAAALDVVRRTHRASTSSLQRVLRISYTRAARLLDQMEEEGIVGPPRGADPREILSDLEALTHERPKQKARKQSEKEKALTLRKMTAYGLPPTEVRQRIFAAIAEAKARKNAKEISPKAQAFVERMDTLFADTRRSASTLSWTDIFAGQENCPSDDSRGCVLPEFVNVGQFTRGETKDATPSLASMDERFPRGTFPCLIPFREAPGICFEGEPDKMEKQAQLCVLRILLSLHPSYVKFTLVDMVTMGRAMGVLSPLNTPLEFKVLSTDGQLELFLEELQEEVRRKNTSTLSKYEWLWQYNEANPAAAEPYRIVMFSCGREGVGQKSAQLLKQLVMRGNAAHAGLYFLFCDAAGAGGDSSRSDRDAAEAQIDADWQRCRQEMGHVVVGSSNGEVFKEGWIDTRDNGIYSGFRLGCPEPSSDILQIAQQRIVDIGKSPVKDAVRISIPASEWWTKTSGEGLTIPIGMQSGAEIQHFTFGNGGNAYHALVGGSTGFGKTVLLHEVILNAAQLYSPAELRMNLLDYKGGTDFSCYKTLPHLDALSIGPDVEFGLDILKDLQGELNRRAEQFRSVGVDNISKFRKKTGEEMPRLLVVIDEFQVLWTDPTYGDQASSTLEDLVRRGRSFGFNFILSTQNLRGANLSAAAKEQLLLRICFNLSQDSCEDFLSPGNMIAAKFTKKGEAVYNERGGLPDGNRLFRCAYLNGAEIVSIIGQLREKVIEKKIEPREPSIYEGDKFVPFSELRKGIGPDVLCFGRTKGLRPVVAGLPIAGEGFRALAVVGGSEDKREAIFSSLFQQLSEMGASWRELQDGSLKDETERWRRWDVGEESVNDCPSVYVVRNLDRIKNARDPDVQSALGGVIGEAPAGASSLLVLESSNFLYLENLLISQDKDKSLFSGILTLDEDGVYEVTSKTIPLGSTEGWWIGPSMNEGRKVALAIGHR